MYHPNRKILATRQHARLPRVVVRHENKLDRFPCLNRYSAPLLQLNLKLNVEDVVSAVTAHLLQDRIRVVRRFTQVPHYRASQRGPRRFVLLAHDQTPARGAGVVMTTFGVCLRTL
ncbi:hypothetical protein D3C80_1470840 [compost metagenome]